MPVTNLEPHHLDIARFDTFDIPRAAEGSKVVDLLNDGACIVLSGKSGVGKSRTIYEILSRYDEFSGFTLLRPIGPVVEPLLDETYIPAGKYVLLLDGLERFSEMTGSVGRMLEVVREAAEQIFVFATVRKESESDPVYLEATAHPELWEGFKEIEIAPLLREEIAEIIDACDTDIRHNDYVDGTPLTALLSFEELAGEYRSLGDLNRPEGLRTVLQAIKTLQNLGQPVNVVSVKKLSLASLEQSQVLDEEIVRLAEAGFFEVVNKDIVCHKRIVTDILGSDLPLEENALKLLIAEARPMHLWWAGVELYKSEKYYKSLRCFENLEEKHWTVEHVEKYLSALRDKLNINVPEEVEAPPPAPEAPSEAAEEKPEAAQDQPLAVAAEEIEAEAAESKTIETQAEEDDAPKRERRRAQIELKRDKETVNYLENWRKEISHQIEMRNFNGAIQNLHRLLATNYNDAETHLALGSLYSRINNPQRADYHLRKGVYLDKTNPVAHSKYAHFLESLNKGTAALNEYFIAGMLEVIKGDVRLESFGKCSELSRKIHNPYVNYLAAAFYTCILYCLGERGDAIEFLDMLEAGYGQYPIVDYLIETLRGKQTEPLEGDDLEAHAARRISQLVAAEMEKAHAPVWG